VDNFLPEPVGNFDTLHLVAAVVGESVAVMDMRAFVADCSSYLVLEAVAVLADSIAFGVADVVAAAAAAARNHPSFGAA
jgi:hypothetical protein